MRLGDALECFAVAALIAAAYDWHHSLALALLAAFVGLFYLAQCHGATKLPRIKPPRLRRKRTPTR